MASAIGRSAKTCFQLQVWLKVHSDCAVPFAHSVTVVLSGLEPAVLSDTVSIVYKYVLSAVCMYPSFWSLPAFPYETEYPSRNFFNYAIANRYPGVNIRQEYLSSDMPSQRIHLQLPVSRNQNRSPLRLYSAAAAELQKPEQFFDTVNKQSCSGKTCCNIGV